MEAIELMGKLKPCARGEDHDPAATDPMPVTLQPIERSTCTVDGFSKATKTS
jgi:hypothetical protein